MMPSKSSRHIESSASSTGVRSWLHTKLFVSVRHLSALRIVQYVLAHVAAERGNSQHLFRAEGLAPAFMSRRTTCTGRQQTPWTGKLHSQHCMLQQGVLLM